MVPLSGGGACGDECGWMAAVVSAVFFGSFAVPIKGPEANSVDIDPLVMQSYKTSMCFITSWSVLLFGTEVYFTPWGIISGIFWVPGGTMAIYAVRNAGLAVSQGTWSCCIVIVSFIWGIFVFRESVRSVFIACFAVFCMGLGLVGMSYYSVPSKDDEGIGTTDAESLTERLTEDAEVVCNTNTTAVVPPSSSKSPELRNRVLLKIRDEEDATTKTSYDPLSDNEEHALNALAEDLVDSEVNDEQRGGGIYYSSDDSSDIVDGDCHMNHLEIKLHTDDKVQIFGRTFHRRSTGLISAFVCGIWGGSIMVPMHYAPVEATGLNYVISFGIGSGIVNLFLWLVRLLYNAYHERSLKRGYHALPSFHFSVMWSAGIRAGTLWSIGNIASILSVEFLGQGVGYSVAQSAMLVSGLWGILWFKEITGPEMISKWLLSAVVTIFGILLLGYEHESESMGPGGGEGRRLLVPAL